MLLEDVPHSGCGDRDVKDDELTDGTYGAWSPGTFGAGGLGVAAAKQVAVPARQCVGRKEFGFLATDAAYLPVEQTKA
ncbi:hypothetical protein [Streptomyces sp. NPDC046197]|uniref:hypothetical protein n=1 Tax=Streptomyces sp. NPDC046197 TaxID=3154337 RepID=UPI0033CEF59C